MGRMYKKQPPPIVPGSQRDWDTLHLGKKRSEMMKGRDSIYFDVIQKLFGPSGAHGMLVTPRITPKIGASEKGRAGRFGHSDYRRKD